MAKSEPTPAVSASTIRQELAEFLGQGPATALEISGALSISEKEVAGHLVHLSRSLSAKGQRLLVDPAECLSCGFRFAKRERLETPGKCPVCRTERIESPRFSIR